MYTGFARIYDQLMRDVDYDVWARRLQEMLLSRGVQKGARVAECACGTGSLTLRLNRMGYRMTGLDLSGDMLELAMDKCRNAGQMIPFIRQDMRSLTLPRKADAVLATCDGVNYLLTEEDLKAFLLAAHSQMKAGGTLIFDVSSPYKLRTLLGNATLTRTEEEFAYIWHNKLDEKKQQVHLDLMLFTREQGEETFIRTTETQTQRIWDRKTLTRMLEECGYENIAFTGRFRQSAPHSRDDRWMVCADRK